jgi:hypothetical protein
MNKLSALFPVFVFLNSLAALAYAQNVGSIRGTVTDPSSAVVPNATVIAAGNGVTRNAKTDGQGRYALTNVPPGKYNIRADASGFVTFVQADVDVNSGQASSLDIALQIATENQQVQVNDQTNTQLSVDASGNTSQLVLRESDLEALPDDPDDLQADLQALAGPAAGPNGAQFFVDGFSGGQLPPKSSIREIRINSNPFASEFDRPGFGRIEILTKPGTDNFHGSAFVNFGDKAFDSRNPLLTTAQPSYNSHFVTANIGGPINKRSSFFLDFNRRDINENALVVASVLDSNYNIVSLNQPVLTPNHLWMISPRIDYQLNANNTLVVRFNHTANSAVGGVGQFSLPTQETQSYNKSNTVQITETAILGNKAVDETAFQFRDSHNNQTGAGSFAIPGINVNNAFQSGGAPFSANFTDTTGYELRNSLTLTQGPQTIKVGFRVRQTNLATQSTTNFNGSYTFLSIQQYQQTQLLLAQGVPMATILNDGYGPTSLTLNSGIPMQSVRQFDLGGFVQDDWRVRQNLTLNFGLRYETQDNIRDHVDLAPRFGFAWAPGAKGNKASKTVLRGGYGIFFDRFDEANVLNALRYNGVSQSNYLINAANCTPGSVCALDYYPNLPPTSLLSVQNQALWRIDPGIRAPYMMQTAIGVDRQLPARTQLSMNLVDTRGLHALRERDVNALLPNGTRPFEGTKLAGANGDIYQYETSGLYKQLQLLTNVNARINSRVQLMGFYVLGWAHTNANGFLMNPYDAGLDWGRANFDVRSRGFVGGTIGLPFRLQAFPFVTMNSGAPFNITTGQQFDQDGQYNARPAFVTASTPAANVAVTRFGVFDKNPAAGSPLIPINYGEGPSQFSVNIRLSRTWSFGERSAPGANNRDGGFNGPPGGLPPGGPGGGPPPGGPPPGGGPGGPFGGFGGGGGRKYSLTLTVSARNAFNHVNLGQPNGDLASPFFGTSTTLANGGPGGGGGGPFGGGGSAAGNRKIEFQARFQF